MASPFIDLGYDSKWLLTDEQLDYFYNNAEKPYLTPEAVEQYKESTGYDHSWVNNVLNLSLIYKQNDDTFSVPKKEMGVKKTHLEAFPQFEGLYDIFTSIETADLSLINHEVFWHHDGIIQENGHGYGFKIIAHGNASGFIMAERNGYDKVEGTDVSLGSESNMFLINNKTHGHYVPPGSEEFIVLFVNGVFNNEINRLCN